MTAPKAFISHASGDKDRFVRGFAEQLRANGVDAWLDDWEMSPGDSLVDRIFEEGIGGADVFIIVVSADSTRSRWVREELNAAVVKRIEGHCKLIPIVLDGTEVPEALRATIYERVDNLGSYTETLDRVVRAIFDVSSRPPLGEPPPFATGERIGQLSAADSVVLAEAARTVLESGQQMVGDWDQLVSRCHEGGLSREAVAEGMLALEQSGLVEEVNLWVRDQRVTNGHFKVSWAGFLRFLEATRPNLGSAQQRAIAEVVNSTAENLGMPVPMEQVAAAAEVEIVVAEALLTPYESTGLLSIARFIGGRTDVRAVSPLLKRELN